MPVRRRRYCFGNIEIDFANLQLTVDGSLRPLEPKAFRLLQFLIENTGRAVSKDEIMSAVWNDVAVTDNALTRAVAQLRKALGDDSKDPRFIETIPTIGYRFLAEPEPEPDPEPAPPKAAKPSRLPAILIAGAAVAVLGVAAYALRHTQHSPSAAPFLSNSQVTSNTGLDVNAVFSPDGHLLAYASDRSGSFEIHVRPLNGGREIQVTSNGGQNFYPSFSPDGQAIAYSSFKDPGIYRTPASGGAIERLTKFGAAPVWSPDGNWIVFLSHDRPTLNPSDYYWPTPETTLWLVPANGGEPMEITPPSKLPGGQEFPSWSPDSKEIRFVNYHSRVPSLYTYTLAGAALQKRFEMPANVTLGSAVFSADSRRLYYISSTLKGDIGIWLQPLDPATLKPDGAPVSVFQPSIGVPRDLAISPEGDRIAFSAVLSNSQIFIQDLKGLQPAGEPHDISRETGFRNSRLAWSPDGRAIVYSKHPVGRPAQSWIDRLDGNPPASIGRENVALHYPTVLQDGKTIRHLQRAPEGYDSIQDVGLADGSVSTNSAGRRLTQASFSLDGRSVAFHTDEPNHQVWKLDIASGKLTQLTFGPDPYGYANFSHDGQSILVQRTRRGDSDVWVIPAGGGKLEPVIDQPGKWYAGSWSADGKLIFVAGNQGNGWAQFAAERGSRRLHRITPDLPLRIYLRYPRISPAGTRLAYEFNESKGNVFIARIAR